MPFGRHASIAVLRVREPFPYIASNGCESLLISIVRHLAGLGLHVRIVSTVGNGLDGDRFEPFPGVLIERIRGVDPRDQQTMPPFEVARSMRRVADFVGDCDVVLYHGGGPIDPISHAAIRGGGTAVSSVHDLVYQNSLKAALDARIGRRVVVSPYLKACLEEIVARTGTGAVGSISVVENGFDSRVMRHTNSESLRTALGLPEGAIPILYPHRMVQEKGIFDAFDLLVELQKRIPNGLWNEVRLLVPVGGLDSASRRCTAVEEADKRGLLDSIVFHDRLPAKQMPAYYSLGVCTLCIGVFPESFGNVQVESMLCGTPVVVARAGAHRSVLPDSVARKVDPYDVDAAADIVAEVLTTRARVERDVREYLSSRFSIGRMLDGYVNALLAEPADLGTADSPTANGNDSADLDHAVVEVPPWCARLQRGYFSDYDGYIESGRLKECLDAMSVLGGSVAEIVERTDIVPQELHDWHRAGLLTVKNLASTDTI